MTPHRRTPEASSPGVVPAVAGAIVGVKSRRGRARLLLLWSAAVVTCVLVAGWLVAGLNPALASAGLSWQSPSFAQDPEDAGWGDEPENWVAWDQESEAWASVLLQNTRPYPVTVAPADTGNVTEVQISAFDPDTPGVDILPDPLTSVPQLEVPSGGYVVVSLHVSDKCVSLAAGTSVGDDSAVVKVTTFGLTRGLEVPFGVNYWAGTTTDHEPDPSCTS